MAAIPLNITLTETDTREGASIKVLVNNGLTRLESTNFSLDKNGHTSRAIVWINMDKVRKYQEINFNNGIRNIVRHGFLHTLGAEHHKKFVYRPLMDQYLSTDKIYWTYDDRKQLRELYPTKKRPATIRKFKAEALGKTAFFICKDRPRSFQLSVVSESQPIWYLPSSECRVIIE